MSNAESKLGKKLAVVKKAADPPRDYFVPNFGKDRDLVINDINLDQAQKQHGHVLQATFEKPKGHPVDYKVPNFGVDKEILATQKHIGEAEKKLGKKFSPSLKAKEFPTDYKVPNLGMDVDIKNTQGSLISSEKKLKTKWNPKKDADGAYIVPTATVTLQTESNMNMESDPICSSAGCTQYEHPKLETHPMDYFVPNFGTDQETVKDNQSSLAVAEKQLNHKLVIPKKEEHDKDYFVPHFGVDPDILATQESEVQASKTLNHSWEPTQDKNGYWNVPQPFDNKSYTYAGTDINVQL